MIEECRRYEVEPPVFEEQSGAVVVTFPAAIALTPQVNPQAVAVLRAAAQPTSRSQLQDAPGLKDREHFRTAYLEPLLAAGWTPMTIPDKPTSSRQRCRTTAAGKKVLREGS